MPYQLPCFKPGDSSTFSVIIDERRWVDELKDKIKEKRLAALGNIATVHLTLYRVEVDEAYNKQERIDELERLFQNLSECTELDEEQQLAEFFDQSPLKGKKYYILVQVPEGKSIHCGGVVLMANVVVQMQPSKNPYCQRLRHFYACCNQ